MVFVKIFLFLLPIGLVGEFESLGHAFTWLVIPFSTLISWVFITMELIGDYSENPFEGLANDVPISQICQIYRNRPKTNDRRYQPSRALSN